GGGGVRAGGAAELARRVPGRRDIPSRSLLGRLRVPLRRPPQPALRELQTWLGDGPAGLKSRARRALEGCLLQWRGERHALDRWLQEMAGGGNLGKFLDLDDLAERHHFISPEDARALLNRPAWNARTRARFIEAVLAALARRWATAEVRHG